MIVFEIFIQNILTGVLYKKKMINLALMLLKVTHLKELNCGLYDEDEIKDHIWPKVNFVLS